MNKVLYIFHFAIIFLLCVAFPVFSQVGGPDADTLDTSGSGEQKTQVLVEYAAQPDWYVYVALDYHPEVEAKRKRYLAMVESAEQAGALEDPQVTAGVFISPIETRVGPQQARLGIRQMFPWFGTLSAKEQLSLLNARSAYYDYLEARAKVALEAHKRYASLYMLGSDTTLIREQIAIYKSLERIALSRYENGEGSLADVLNVQLMIAEMESALTKKEEDLKTAIYTFNLALYRDVAEVPAIPDTLMTVPRTVGLAGETQESFRIQGALQNIEASRQRGEVARLAGNPMLGAGVDYVITGKRDDMMMPDNGKDAIMPMVTVSLPIFRKKYKSMVREAELGSEAAEAELEGLRNRIASEYMEAAAASQNAGTDIALYGRQIYLAEKAQNLLISSYSAGNEDLDEILDIQQKILRYRMALNEAQARQFINRKKIDYLAGADQAVLDTTENGEFEK